MLDNTRISLTNGTAGIPTDRLLAVDTETDGLYGPITLAQFAWREDGGIRVILIRRPEPLWLADTLLQANRIVLHNAAYDLETTQDHSGVPMRNAAFEDTMLLARAANHRLRLHSFSLDAVVSRVCRLSPQARDELGSSDPYGALGLTKKALQSSDWSGPLTEEQMRYAALDVVSVLVIYPWLDHQATRVVYHLDRKATAVAIDISRHGLHLDMEGIEAIRAEQEAAIIEHAAALPYDFNVNSYKQVRALFNSDASDDIFLASKEQHGSPIERSRAYSIRRIRRARKLMQFLDKYRQHAADHGGRLTGHFSFTAVSGRGACSHENLQQIPRALKKLIVPAPNRALMASDYSQLELRYACALSADRRMATLLKSGADLHQATADSMGVARQYAKNCNFNLIYGGSAKMLHSLLIKQGSEVTYQDTVRMRRAWLNLYRGISRWHERTKAAHAKGAHTTTALGRYMVPKLFTDALNLPVQAGSAEVAKLAMVRFDTWLREQGLDARIILFVHDSYVLDVPKDDREQLALIASALAHEMQQAWRDITSRLPIRDIPMPVDVAVGLDWPSADSGKGENAIAKWSFPDEVGDA